MFKKALLLLSVILLTSCLFSAENQRGSFGVGFGLPYGTMGMNLDYYANPYVALTAGLGTTTIAGAGFNIGAKYYFTNVKKPFRPRLTAIAGINGALREEIYKNDAKISADKTIIEESFLGISLGLGAMVTWGDKNHQGLDFDVFYISNSGLYDRISDLNHKGYKIDNPSRVCVSLGYRYQF